MIFRQSRQREVSLDTLKSAVHILVIDDLDFPYQKLFRRDGYNIERWADVESLPPLTNGNYALLLLDVQGIGLVEDKEKAGLGILEHVKTTNPAQAVIVYSSDSYRASKSRLMSLADAVLDKDSEYPEFKAEVDRILLAQTNEGYFVQKFLSALGPEVTTVPRASSLALKAIQTGQSARLESYLARRIRDTTRIETALHVVSASARLLEGLGG